MSSLEHNAPFRHNTILRINNAEGRAFISIAGALIERDGWLHLNDKVHKYFPKLPAWSEGYSALMTRTTFQSADLRDLRRFYLILTCDYIELNARMLTITCECTEMDKEIALKAFNAKVKFPNTIHQQEK